MATPDACGLRVEDRDISRMVYAKQETVYAKQESDRILGTLDKGLHVLQVIAETDAPNGMTLTELGTAVGMHRTTLFRILATLEARNFLIRDSETDRYQLGIGVLSLGSMLLRNLNIRDTARPILQSLCERTQELVFLTVRAQAEIVTVEAFQSSQEISLRADIGDRRPMYCTASGKAILAFLPEVTVDSILQSGMPSITPRTITSPVVLYHDLEGVRTRGFAWDDEERIEGVRCVAAPIFNGAGDVCGAASLAAPTMRTPWARLQELGQDVKMAAGEVSAQLGFTQSHDTRGRSSNVAPTLSYRDLREESPSRESGILPTVVGGQH